MPYSINEEMHIRANKKLRDAIHDIVVDLDADEYLDLGTVSNVLKHKYSVNITPNLLKRLIDLWDDDKSTSYFKKKDARWLRWDDKNEFILNNLKTEKNPVLGKSGRKIKKKEGSEIIKAIKDDGWKKTQDGDWVFVGNTAFNTRGADDSDDGIDITKFEKTEYKPGENPINDELFRRTFIQKDNQDVESEEMIKKIGEIIAGDGISSSASDGAAYYNEIWRIMMHLGKERDYERFRDYLKYAPSKVKEIMLRKKKEAEERKDKEESFSKDPIMDRGLGLDELGKLININNLHHVLVLKKKGKEFFIKKLIKGYMDISDETYADGSHKIVMKLDKNSKEDENEVIYFDSFYHFYKSMSGGLENGPFLFIFIRDEKETKIKFYFKEFRKFKDWDEHLDKNSTDNIKNDF